MEGGTGAGPHIATEETGIPGIAAIRQARKALDDVGKTGEISLVYAGGIRNGGDVAKALALGADAVAIGHSALDGAQLQQGYPRGRLREGNRRRGRAIATTATPAAARSASTTQDPVLRKRLDPDEAAERVYNFLHSSDDGSAR